MSESEYREKLATVGDAHYPVRSEAAGGGRIVRVCRCGDVWTPDHLADALSPVLAQMRREWQAEALAPVLALAQEWEQEADEDDLYVNRAHASEIQDVMAQVRINRAHAQALRAEASGQEGEL